MKILNLKQFSEFEQNYLLHKLKKLLKGETSTGSTGSTGRDAVIKITIGYPTQQGAPKASPGSGSSGLPTIINTEVISGTYDDISTKLLNKQPIDIFIYAGNNSEDVEDSLVQVIVYPKNIQYMSGIKASTPKIIILAEVATDVITISWSADNITADFE